MSIRLVLSKEGEQSLIKRTSQHSQNQAKQQLKLKQSPIVSLKHFEVETNANTPKQQHSEQEAMTVTVKESWQFQLSEKDDHHRHPLAHKSGGMTCDDPKQIEKLRSVGKEMIKLIGRKILCGQFNLTKISIPIKSCYPKTALYNSVKGYSIFPYFMKTAAQQSDPLEQFKITLTCLIAQPYYLNMFLKPLNPLLGETLQSTLPDGTQIYVEQISHHPPISYFLICGPGYRFSGYYDVEVSPSINSLTIRNKGKRKFEFFNNNTVIQTTYATNEFSGTFFGTSTVEDVSSFKIQDKKNGLWCEVEFGKVKKKSTDHFLTHVYNKNKPLSQLEGTCLGYLNIDGRRYWDGRDIKPSDMVFGPLQKRLPSDWERRTDLQALEKGRLEEAQMLKERLEQMQRLDAKLRKKHSKQ